MNIIPVASLHESALVAAARDRLTVQLRSGRRATLRRWRGTRSRPGRSRSNSRTAETCTVVFSSGKVARLNCVEVAAVIYPAGVDPWEDEPFGEDLDDTDDELSLLATPGLSDDDIESIREHHGEG